MDKQLKSLFNYVKFNDNKNEMKDAKLTKITVYEEKEKVEFYIEIPYILSVETYNDLKNKIKESFKELKKATFFLNVLNIDYQLMPKYLDYTLKNMYDYAPGYRMLEIKNISIEDKKIILNANNLLESNRLSKHVDLFNKMYIHYGFKECKTKVKLKEIEMNCREISVNKESNDFTKNSDKNNNFNNKTKKFNYAKKNNGPKITEEGALYGKVIKTPPISIKEVKEEAKSITIDGMVFGADFFESSKTNFKIITLKVTDYTDSMYVKIFFKDEKEFNRIKKETKKNKWFRFKGAVKNDDYAKDLVLSAYDINPIEGIKRKDDLKFDDAKEKRVELHAHTKMSQMDGIITDIDLINRAKKWGHKAVAITDHNSVQSFPHAFYEAKDLKVLYGVELELIDDEVEIVTRENDQFIKNSTYVVFDFETTGFNAGGGDSIIEIGAVKLENGEIIDTFSELIDPKRKLPEKIIEVTNITDEMLIGKRSEKEAIKDFVEWTGNLTMVAHNSKFDESFLAMCYEKYDLGKLENTIIDTLELSRVIDQAKARHNLAAITKRYGVSLEGHHRAVNDSEATALVFAKMIDKLNGMNIEKITDINKMVSKEEIHKIGKTYHVTLIAKTNEGLKNLFELVSLANTKYLHKKPRILRSEIERLRKGILVGSACAQGEVFSFARTKSEEELSNIVKFYDYIEVQPPSVNNHLIQTNDFGSNEELIENIMKIINVSEAAGKIVVATGDVHHLDESDKIYREIIINQKIPGGGLHPLNKKNITNIPSQHFMTTNEMLDEFSFLGFEKARKIVIENTNKIADMVDVIKVIKDDLYTPKIENSVEIVKKLVYDTATNMYGKNLPTIIEERLEKELDGLISKGFEVIYLISQKLVKKSNDDGYLVGSRGSVGSSLVATMMGITEVNPLPPHYYCKKCKKSIFEIDGRALGEDYSSGYDLPDRVCECGEKMVKEGNDMPFATFLGFNGDKVPDIDLNFSGEYQPEAHNFTKEMFGETKAFRAGTIGTVAEKTAIGFVLGYAEDNDLKLRRPEIERLSMGCTGVKRTSGQHPGGIVVLDKSSDITDFTPYQYPADDKNSSWFTTHFDYHAIDANVLKLDILGHDDPTTLKKLEDISGVDLKTIPFDDKDVMKLFSSPDILGVTKEEISCSMGTLGIPEFGTKFVIGMLEDTHPKTFGELLKISGLSHGTDVWLGNAQELIKENICEFKDVIGCRDDIMVYLMYGGLKPIDSFKIMEFVRKGKASKDPEKWEEYAALMREKNIPEWYIESCHKIKYMFPKAHAAAYVMMALRIAWFKVHMPIHYYAAYFSVRCHDFDITSMINGYDEVKKSMIAIDEKGYEASNKEISIRSVLHLALEMLARGFKFSPISLDKSDSDHFIIDEDKKSLIPPFRTIDGLGDTVAKNIIKERKIKDFLSIEELQKRCKVSSTIIDKMRLMGILDDLPESNQLSLF